MKPSEAEKIILKDGWRLKRTKGGHRIYEHPTKKGNTVIPWHNKDLKLGTLKNIER